MVVISSFLLCSIHMTHGVVDREDTEIVWQVLCLITELMTGMTGNDRTDPSPTFRYEWKFSGCSVLSLQSQPDGPRWRTRRSDLEALQGGHGVWAQWHY